LVLLTNRQNKNSLKIYTQHYRLSFHIIALLSWSNYFK